VLRQAGESQVILALRQVYDKAWLLAKLVYSSNTKTFERLLLAEVTIIYSYRSRWSHTQEMHTVKQHLNALLTRDEAMLEQVSYKTLSAKLAS